MICIFLSKLKFLSSINYCSFRREKIQFIPHNNFKPMRTLLLFITFHFMTFGFAQNSEKHTVRLVENPDDQSVNVLFDGELFTSYIHPKTIMKPVLWPVITSEGTVITRSYPLEKVAGE